MLAFSQLEKEKFCTHALHQLAIWEHHHHKIFMIRYLDGNRVEYRFHSIRGDLLVSPFTGVRSHYRHPFEVKHQATLIINKVHDSKANSVHAKFFVNLYISCAEGEL